MSLYRVGLSSLPFPRTPEEAVRRVEQAVAQAGRSQCELVCFGECYVPGYRTKDNGVPPPDPAFLEQAQVRVAAAARQAEVAVMFGTERVTEVGVVPCAVVFDATGARVGVQDKLQLDPSEDGIYVPGTGRRVFQVGRLTFGVVICHEGFRYPETVRWAARRGAALVLHPHYSWAEPGNFRPTEFGDPRNSFHEKAVLCRAAENTCYVASINYASAGSPTTSAVARPDGTLQAFQPYGVEGLLVADLDLGAATCLLAKRYKPLDFS